MSDLLSKLDALALKATPLTERDGYRTWTAAELAAEADFKTALVNAWPAIAKRLRAAQALFDAVERTGFDLSLPAGPDGHSEIYSLDNETVRLIASSMDAYRAVAESEESK